MAQTSTEKMRQWTGPAILSFGFRPFFFFGALWAALAMALWIAMLTGILNLPTHFDPVSWHAHEFLFGYLGAIIAGFLLTAVPNWTGRLPVVGWLLGGLVLIWATGRLAISISALMPQEVAIALDLAFPTLFSLLILREIVVGKNWRNLIVFALLVVFTLANGLFHWAAINGESPAQTAGMRLGIAAAILLISVIGGRIVPSFTRNWLVKTNHKARPTPPMQRFDKITLLITAAGLLGWVIWPSEPITAIGLIITGALQFIRLWRWKGFETGTEPLVWVLHLGYAFIPIGALCVGASILLPDLIGLAAAQHVWMAGAIGLMTLAVMTRATLGHTGRDLRAGVGTTALYLALVGAVVIRLLAGVWPQSAMSFYTLSALLWISAFVGFATLYGPLLLRRRPKQL